MNYYSTEFERGLVKREREIEDYSNHISSPSKKFKGVSFDYFSVSI